MFDLLTSSGLGSLLGMRHALEPDHLAAVSTLVGNERSSVKAALLGLWWGIGHTLSLLSAGVVLMLLRADMPGPVSALFECAVGAMLVVLGIRAVGHAAEDAGPRHAHRRALMVHQH